MIMTSPSFQAPIPTNKQGVEPKRPSRPVNITHYCRLSPTISNSLFISWSSEHGKVCPRLPYYITCNRRHSCTYMYSKSSLQNYCVCVDLVRKLNSDILMQRIKTKGAKHPDYTKALSKCSLWLYSFEIKHFKLLIWFQLKKSWELLTKAKYRRLA